MPLIVTSPTAAKSFWEVDIFFVLVSHDQSSELLETGLETLPVVEFSVCSQIRDVVSIARGVHSFPGTLIVFHDLAPTALRHAGNEVRSVVFFFQRCLHNQGSLGIYAAHHGLGKVIKTPSAAVYSFMGVDVMQVFHEAESVTSHRIDCVYQAISTTGQLFTAESSCECLGSMTRTYQRRVGYLPA